MYVLFSVCLRTTDHLNLKSLIFSGHTASFKIEISKVQDFGNFELSPMHLGLHCLPKYYLGVSSLHGVQKLLFHGLQNVKTIIFSYNGHTYDLQGSDKRTNVELCLKLAYFL